MRVFLAGVIQGGRTDDGIHSQDYRRQLTALITAAVPGATIIDPHTENLGRLDWQREQQSEMFLRYARAAAHCDVLIAWLPEPSMGTAIEMYEAYQAGVPVIAITALTGTWAIFSLATVCVPDLAGFADLVASGEFTRLAGTRVDS
ncbi:hypothetical protein ACFVWG_02805 [Kribbella sp. NPDC058245]|uniref:hypothetical protein n=1 Tax=Kribbella sp. NPDC058245 TaxID=3346399 RepID=UPI0036ED30C1